MKNKKIPEKEPEIGISNGIADYVGGDMCIVTTSGCNVKNETDNSVGNKLKENVGAVLGVPIQINNEKNACSLLFKPTRIIGDRHRIYIDEKNNRFSLSGVVGQHNNLLLRAIPLENVHSVHIELRRNAQEILVKNPLKRPLSFNPKCYNISFDFYVSFILVSSDVPYVFKLNSEPIGVYQPSIIVLNGKTEKAEIVSRGPYYAFLGKTTNEDIVREDPVFKRYIRFCKLIYKYFPNCKTSEESINYCKWCGSEMNREPFICPHCCGSNMPGA